MATTGLTQEKSSGFTLLELAIVLTIIGILMLGATGSVKRYVENNHFKTTQQYLQQARKALLTYVALYGALPCPDSDNDGRSDDEFPGNGSAECRSAFGLLPYLELGLQPETSWGYPAVYAINRRAATHRCAESQSACFFREAGQVGFKTTYTSGGLEIRDSSGKMIAESVLAIVMSYGSNSGATFAACANSGGEDEQANCTNNGSFTLDRSRDRSGDFFDDQLIWIDALAFKGHLLQTHRLQVE